MFFISEDSTAVKHFFGIFLTVNSITENHGMQIIGSFQYEIYATYICGQCTYWNWLQLLYTEFDLHAMTKFLRADEERSPGQQIYIEYRQTSHISYTVVGNNIVDHSDVVGA